MLLMRPTPYGGYMAVFDEEDSYDYSQDDDQIDNTVVEWDTFLIVFVIRTM